MIDPGPKQPENRMHLFDPVGLINDNYAQYGVRPRRATTGGGGGGGGGLKFAVEPKASESDSNSSSPRLWKPESRANSPPMSPRFASSPPESMSPSSRTQAIARGRRELMDMIKDMPESCYELSLRDIVEQKTAFSPLPPPASVGTVEVRQPSQESKRAEGVGKKMPSQEKKSKKKKVAKSESKKKMVKKNKSMDNGGFLLKTTVFPIPFRSKKSKKGLSAAPSFKVAALKPNPKGSGRRWWVRKSRVSNDNQMENAASGSSSRSSSIVSRHKHSNRLFLPSCCSFFNDNKVKPKK